MGVHHTGYSTKCACAAISICTIQNAYRNYSVSNTLYLIDGPYKAIYPVVFLLTKNLPQKQMALINRPYLNCT